MFSERVKSTQRQTWSVHFDLLLSGVWARVQNLLLQQILHLGKGDLRIEQIPVLQRGFRNIWDMMVPSCFPLLKLPGTSNTWWLKSAGNIHILVKKNTEQIQAWWHVSPNSNPCYLLAGKNRNAPEWGQTTEKWDRKDLLAEALLFIGVTEMVKHKMKLRAHSPLQEWYD